MIDQWMLWSWQINLINPFQAKPCKQLVELQSPEEIRHNYPDGVRELADGGTWNTIAGQPTDESEMALLLARMLAERGAHDSSRREISFPQEGP